MGPLVLLFSLKQQWSDASSVETKVKIKTTCKKPKKQKKAAEGSAVTGDGVGVGKGSGKGSGKGGTSNNNVNADTTGAAVTTNTTSSTTASSSTNATSATSGTDVYRSLQTNSTNSNVFGNKTSSTTTTSTNNNTASTTNNTPNSTFVVAVSNVNSGKGGAKGGKKGTAGSKKAPPNVSADGIPFCEEEDDGSAVTTPSAPGTSPALSPTAVSAPSVSVQSPALSSPIVSIPLSVPSDSSVVTEASVCEAYKFGAAPTDAPLQNHTTLITMNVDVGSDINSIYSQMGTVLRQKIGPLLLDCVSERRLSVQREEQENATELVNVVFSDPTFTGGTYAKCYIKYGVPFSRHKNVLTFTYFLAFLESCSVIPENATCVPSMFTSKVFFNGDEPVGFDEKLRQAMLFTDFDIPGLQNFASVDVSEIVDEGAAEPEPAGQPTDRAPETTAVETTQRSRNGPSPGVSVAVAVSLLALVLAAIFVVRRHREAKSSDSLSKHIEFTDDFPDDAGAETADDNSANSPLPMQQKSYVVSDQSLDESWNAISRRSVNEGQEVYNSTPSISRDRKYPEISFVETGGPDPRLMNLPRRFYESADTVNL